MDHPDTPHRPLAGRKALVTAGGRRLGRAMVLALAQAGADVAVHHRGGEDDALRTCADARSAGVHAAVVQADLVDPGACAQVVESAWEGLGGLDILVNNAAIFDRTPLETLVPEDFRRQMAVNAGTVHDLSLAAGRRMLSAGGGDIVNLACASAYRPYPAYVPYSASKAAVVSLTQGFAKLFAPTVRVNGIAPGPILPAAGELEGQGARAVEATLLKRWGAPEDIAAALLFLLRARYVTGYTLPVDGGRSLAGSPAREGPGRSPSSA